MACTTHCIPTFHSKTFQDQNKTSSYDKFQIGKIISNGMEGQQLHRAHTCVCLVSMVEIEVNALLKDIRAVFELNSGIGIFGSA